MSVEKDVDADVKKINDVYARLEKDDDDKAVKAIDAVYKKKEKTYYNDAIKASLAPSASNIPVGNASANKTKKNLNPLKKRMPNNNTRRKLTDAMVEAFNIIASKEIEEKTKLESQLPHYWNGAMVDIIERDGHCFFRSITHQLRAYGFNVSTEYQTVRNLVAEYIENSDHITLDMIRVESPNYTSRTQYTNAVRQGLWGGKIEIIAIHDGCLSSLTYGQSLRINIYSVNNGQIELHPGFIGTRPDDEGEQLIERLPIRLLYVGNNHFHRIYFNDINYQKLDYHNEVRPAELISGQYINPDTGMTVDEELRQIYAYNQIQKDESASQWNCAECTFLNDAGTTNCVACDTDKNVKKKPDSIYKHNIVQNVEVFGYVNGAGIHYQQDNNKINDVHVIEITPEIQQMFETINAANTDNMNSKNHNEHKQEIGFKHLIDIDNLGQWTEESQKVVAFVPKEQKRPPPATVEKDDNTNKTFINVSIHDWVCFGTEPNESNTITKYPFLKLDIPQGIEETVGNDIDIYPVTSKWTQLQYLIHNLDDDPASYSPDTGIIVLDDKFDGNPSCKIICVDVLTKRILRVELTFIRDENIYKNRNNLNIGGKSRRTRKSRKQRRRRQTKRR